MSRGFYWYYLNLVIDYIEHFQCSDCELTRNLWLCLECGEFHCGRKQWDIGAAPGNGHAIEHFKKTGHSLVVKLSSIQEVGFYVKMIIIIESS